MQRYGWDVRFILGEVERDKLPVSNLRIIQRVAPVVWCGDLDQLADQLQDSDAYLGNDSGPTHLAALTGLATVAMFGPNSDPTVWAPRGPRVKILRFDSPPESVVESLLNVSAT
jgi:ADP-heptose:LPS heptosyltransferase